jgi:hypothetical protein
MSTATSLIGVRHLAALLAFAQIRSVAPYPPTIVCVAKDAAGPDSIWIDIGCPVLDYGALWRTVYPDACIPAGHQVAPLVSREEANRRGFRFVRLGLVGLGGARQSSDGGYVVTGLSHSATYGL